MLKKILVFGLVLVGLSFVGLAVYAQGPWGQGQGAKMMQNSDAPMNGPMMNGPMMNGGPNVDGATPGICNQTGPQAFQGLQGNPPEDCPMLDDNADPSTYGQMGQMRGQMNRGQMNRGQMNRGQMNQGQMNQRQMGYDTPIIPSDDTPLSEAEHEALLAALDDEYHAWAVYDQVIQDFGEVWPFVNIQRSEEMHINAVSRLLEAYKLPVPENTWVGNVDSYASLSEACAAGVTAEDVNGGLYDTLLTSTDRPEIIQVLENLQWASLNRHYPMFEQCAAQ